MIEIRRDNLSGAATRALLALHVQGMQAHTPAGHVHALDLSGLTAPNVRVWSAWIDGDIAGIAALKTVDPETGEVKSMRTHPDHLRKGVAAALLEHLIVEARQAGFRRLSLETGTGDAFEPALALYRRRGFASGPAFGDYRASPFNQFLHLALSA